MLPRQQLASHHAIIRYLLYVQYYLIHQRIQQQTDSIWVQTQWKANPGCSPARGFTGSLLPGESTQVVLYSEGCWTERANSLWKANFINICFDHSTEWFLKIWMPHHTFLYPYARFHFQGYFPCQENKYSVSIPLASKSWLMYGDTGSPIKLMRFRWMNLFFLSQGVVF